jgi:hypothetical protein
MEAFAFIPPEWTNEAIHAHDFCCPKCHSSSLEATQVWINRRAPVTTENYKRKWQEFYKCQCGCVWWAWSNDRPPTNLNKPNELDEL